MDGITQGKLSKKKLIAALFTLMAEKPFVDIKVTEIADRAGVARLTFYRHFQTKEDVIEERCRQLFEAYFSEIQPQIAKMSLSEVLQKGLESWLAHQQNNRLIAQNNLMYLVEKGFYGFEEQLADVIPELQVLTSMRRAFVLAGLVRVFFKWIQMTEPKSADQVATEILGMFKAIN